MTNPPSAVFSKAGEGFSFRRYGRTVGKRTAAGAKAECDFNASKQYKNTSETLKRGKIIR